MHSPRNRILYVDAHEDSRLMMKVVLEMLSYEVSLAGTAADGLHLAQGQHFDMCMLDTHLPDESGFELCKQICGIPGHAPVVFISAATDEIDKQRGRQAGALAYLTKPLDFDVLEITLTRLITQALRKGLGKYWCVSHRLTANQ